LIRGDTNPGGASPEQVYDLPVTEFQKMRLNYEWNLRTAGAVPAPDNKWVNRCISVMARTLRQQNVIGWGSKIL